jgi:hypothetical protein
VIAIAVAWLWLGGELLLVLGVALLVLLIGVARRRRRDRRAAMHLVGAVKAAAPGRRAETRALLEGPYGYSGEPLAQALHDIMRAETQLYQRVIDMYVKRDAAALRELLADIQALSAPLRGLRVPTGTPAATGAEGAATNGELARLQGENESLQQELQITMETMSRMLSEYASMIGGGPETLVESKTLQGMLSGAAGAVTVAGVASGPTGGGEAALGDLGALEELPGLSGPGAGMDWDDAILSGGDASGEVGADLAPDRGHDEWDLAEGTEIDSADNRRGGGQIGGAATATKTGGGTGDLDDIWAAALEEQALAEQTKHEREAVKNSPLWPSKANM